MIKGSNSRLDGLQVAILSAKLPYLKQLTEARISNAATYTELLHGSSVKTPLVKEGYKHVHNLYVINTHHREELVKLLKANEIETAVHYPTVLPFLT